MRQLALTLVILFAVATGASGHAGEVHTYMGTITTLHDDGSFVLKKTDGKTIHVNVGKSTTYVQADGRPGTRSELKENSRVVVKIAKDGKTALSVKMAAPKKRL